MPYSNFYHHIYQGKKHRKKYGLNVDNAARDIGIPSDKQIKFYKDMKKFAEEHGMCKTEPFSLKTKDDYRTAINGLTSILKRNDLLDEFYKTRGGDADDAKDSPDC